MTMLRAAGMLFVLVACMALATQVRADLPIHCLNSQVAGEWEFTLNEGRHSLPSSGDLSGVSCGYPQPDRNADHFTRPPVLVAARTVKVSLREPNIAVDAAGNKGTWTMVYDEGFEVRVGGRVYFAYSKYTPNSGTSLSSDKVAHYTSHCDETMVGWVHADDNTQWGCFRGKQTKPANAWAKPVSRVKDDGKDLAPVVSPTVLLEEFVRILPRDTDVEATLPAPESSARETVLLEEDAEVDVSADRGVRMAGEEMGDEEPVMEPLHALLSQTATELPELDESVLFEPDHVFIERHNRNSRNLWKAKSPVELEHKPVAHMLRMLGLRRYSKENTGPGGVKLRQPIHDTRPDKVKYAGLPEEWDWSDRNGISYDTEIRNQGSCGSCYAMASVSALEARYRIKSRLAFRPVLSPQEVVSCSFYNQGCQGGYPFLVAKHGAEFGMVDAACAPYTARNSECRVGACKNERLRMHNYSYVGGYMGGCSEAAMMREIYANGPVMVAFQAPPDLFYYTGGIYTGPSPKQESQGNVPGVNVWQQTNHAVVAVGWGVDRKTGTKFWKVKNTWGLKWGERGYFRIRRGTNECGIESMATKADVILPESVTVPADAPDPWAPEVRGAKKHVARMRKARTVKATRKHKRGY